MAPCHTLLARAPSRDALYAVAPVA